MSGINRTDKRVIYLLYSAGKTWMDHNCDVELNGTS